MATDRFDALALALGATAVLGSLAISMSTGRTELLEVLGQLMLLLVLFAAVKGGRKAGLIAAVVASAVYVFLRLPLLTQVPVSPLLLSAMVVRLTAYGLVGIVVGEICSRIRYALAGFEDTAAIDDWSRVYNQVHAAASITKAIGRYTRYAEHFSILLVAISPSVFSEMRPLRQRKVVRTIADHIRGDVRLVDEIARLDDGRFVVLLPHTPKEGAIVVERRVAAGLPRLLGASNETVTISTLSAPQEIDALTALAKALAPENDDGPQSAEYSSDAVSTRNPAAESTSSAR